MADEQVLLAVCQLLDAPSRGFTCTPDAVPRGVERAAERLAEQLQRADRPGAESRATAARASRTGRG